MDEVLFSNSLLLATASLCCNFVLGFLKKHYRDQRLNDLKFMLDFKEIYVIDSKTKSIIRAKVLVMIFVCDY